MLDKGDIVGGKYEILSRIGKGGMSNVFLAEDRKTKKRWALKEVRRDGVEDFKIVRQSLVAETDILKKLSHPNLPDIADIIENDDDFIIVMEYIEGKTLMEVITEKGAQPESYVTEWAKQLCDVLEYLHTRKPAIIYRDMKPSNIMLRPDGSVCLIDFGTAREYKEKNLADTVCLGTFGYAAPEQFGGFGQTDARTDIYCLGATLYHLVTGINPADPPYEMQPIRNYNKSLSPALEEIILKCTQSNPSDRYQSCAQLRRALDRIDITVSEYNIIQKRKLNMFLLSIIATLLCGAVGIAGLVLKSLRDIAAGSTLAAIGFIMAGVCLAVTVIIYYSLNIKKAYINLRDGSGQQSERRQLVSADDEAYENMYADILQKLPDDSTRADTQDSLGDEYVDILGASATTEINDSVFLNTINSDGGRFIIIKSEMLINTDKTI